MTEREKQLILKERKWEKEKGYLERELTLEQDKKDFKNKFRRKIANSKLLIWFLFINCTIIEIFTGWVTVKEIYLASQGILNPDLSPLLALIGAVVTEVIGFAIYSLKSTKENTAGGIVYEATMQQFKFDEENSDG